MTLSLDQLSVGGWGTIICVEHPGTIRRRLADLGFQTGMPVSCVGKSPLGDPHAYLICGAVIALRNRDSEQILIRL